MKRTKQKQTKTKRRWLTASKIIAFWMLALTSFVSAWTIRIMVMCVNAGYMGGLLPLSALITLCQAGNAFVLGSYFGKSKAENTAGGITYETAMAENLPEIPIIDVSDEVPFPADGVVRDA